MSIDDPAPPWSATVLSLEASGVRVTIAALDRAALARGATGGDRALRPGDRVLVERDEVGAYWVVAAPFAADSVREATFRIEGDGQTTSWTFALGRRPCAAPAVWDDAGNLIEVTVMYDSSARELTLAFGTAPSAGADYDVAVVW